jgi:cell division septum initiation protein DivIVA
MDKKIEQLENRIQELENLLEENQGLNDRIKELEYKLEKHKHSGKETADISNILSERLGLKVSSGIGASENYTIELGSFVQTGSSSNGYVGFLTFGEFFGLRWSGGSNPTLEIQIDYVPAYANNAAAIADGLTEGQIYRTNGDPDTLCIVH